jgi:hypothetical protein
MEYYMSAVEKEVSEKVVAKKDAEVVTLTDGRKVEFVGKRKLLKDYTVDGSRVILVLDFRNGETRSIALPDSLILQFAGHGAAQKYGDETAGLDDVDDMVLAIDELDGHIQAGEWSSRKEGSGLGGTSVLLKALVEFTGKTAEVIKEFLSGKSQAEKLALRASAKLKPIIDRLEAEKVSKAAKVNTDELFAQLD